MPTQLPPPPKNVMIFTTIFLWGSSLVHAAECPIGTALTIEYTKIVEIPRGGLYDKNGRIVEGRPMVAFDIFFSRSTLEAITTFSKKYSLCRTNVTLNNTVIGMDTFSPFSGLDEIASNGYASFFVSSHAGEENMLFSSLVSHKAEISIVVSGK
ncbi:MAG: hypothetical protein AB7F41_08005 [Methylocystis sp.]|uniref:hypothetical protein n=1 Tax=Methylocystis sp. TaxID=1911079 RepID=UPI003D0BEEEF